jgi:penicillin-binding protein 1A
MTSEISAPPSRKSPEKRKVYWVLFCVFIGLLVVSVALVAGFYIYFSKDLPRLTSVKDYSPNVVTRVFSEHGEVIAEFFVEKRYAIPIEDMPTELIEAFIAAEDARFFEHQGVDFFSIIRALKKNITSMDIVQGGSTITQQITKSLLLTPEKSYARKIKEAILAYRIEKSLSKSDILSIYLNQIYLGHRSYGIEAAALTYFGKTASQLNLAESALLAGLPKWCNGDILRKRKLERPQRYP